MNRLLWAPLIGALIFFWSPNNATAEEIPAETLAVCARCHGEAGVPTDHDVPIIWGQEFYYLYVQLKDFKSGRRVNEAMSDIIANLDKETMQALAQYFSEQTWPRIGYTAPAGAEAKALTALDAGECFACHLGGFEGNSRVPRLAGQQLAYLERSLREFKTKVRLNAPFMNSLLNTYSDEDLVAVAQHLAGLQVLPKAARVFPPAAKSRAVLPERSRRVASAPASRSRITIPACPCAAAVMRAVRPRLSATSRAAPRSSNRFRVASASGAGTSLLWPAAHMSAVKSLPAR